MSDERSVGGYEMPASWDEASDEFKARVPAAAQLAWANLGGLGPVPRRMGFGDYPQDWFFCLAVEHPDALDWAKGKAENERHELRLRLIEAAVSGHAGRLSDPDTSARLAVELADAVLARLEAEAKVGA